MNTVLSTVVAFPTEKVKMARGSQLCQCARVCEVSLLLILYLFLCVVAILSLFPPVVLTVLEHIQYLLAHPEHACGCGYVGVEEAVKLITTDKPEFDRVAREWTEQYAH